MQYDSDQELTCDCSFVSPVDGGPSSSGWVSITEGRLVDEDSTASIGIVAGKGVGRHSCFLGGSSCTKPNQKSA